MDRTEIHRHVSRLFAGGPRTTGVGIEHELLTADASTGAPVPIERVRVSIAGAAYRRWVAFEPGGQVELSLPVAPDPKDLAENLAAAVAALRRDCAAAGIRLLDEPVDRRALDTVPLQLTSARYRAMARRFDIFGPAGRRMLRQTASTQLCLDWWAGSAGREQWRLLNLAGPSLAAVFARSAGAQSRLATWLAVDPTRTAFDDRLLGSSDPVTAYADFAAGAVPITSPDDVEQHLTTLFPPVRPRGRYLEVRFLDVQPTASIELVATVLATLVHDDECRARAQDVVAGDTGRLAERWEQSARGDTEVIAKGLALVDLALAHARRRPLVNELDGAA
jgi:glutamate--cysteine ligase